MRHPSLDRIRDLFDGVVVDCRPNPSFAEDGDGEIMENEPS